MLKGEGVDRAECFTLWGLSNSLQTISRRAVVEVAPHLPFVDLGVVTLASRSLSFLDREGLMLRSRLSELAVMSRPQ